MAKRPRKPGGSFWDWLAANTERIQREIATDSESIIDSIDQAFEQAYPDLTWDMGPTEEGVWVFCISADGDIERFPKVIEVAGTAPEIPGWIIQAFRPRGDLDTEVQAEEVTLRTDDVWCSVNPLRDGLELTLHIRGLNRDNEEVLGDAAVILLDNAIGEYDAVILVEELQFQPLVDTPRRSDQFFPLRDLPGYIDQLPEKDGD